MNVPKILKVAKIFTNRTVFRYIPAAGTLILSQQLLRSQNDNVYSDFALFISFGSLLPIVDFGYSSRIMLSNGERSHLQSGLSYSIVVFFVVLVFTCIGILSDTIEPTRYVSFVVGAAVILPVYFLSRHCYVVQGPDKFNLKSMAAYPLLMAGLLAGLHFSLLSPVTVSVTGSLAVIFAPFVMGLRRDDFLAFRGLRILDAPREMMIAIGDSRNLHLTLAALIAFVGAWSNIIFLRWYGTDSDVVEYDLVWRLASVTMFSQIVLNHSLPRIVRSLSESNGSIFLIYQKTFLRSILLTLCQLIVLAFLWIPYQRFLGKTIDVLTFGSGVMMSVVFAFGIPGNYILQASGRFSQLHFVFASSAAIAIALKFSWGAADGLSAHEAFLSTAIGYSVGVLLLHAFVHRVREL